MNSILLILYIMIYVFDYVNVNELTSIQKLGMNSSYSLGKKVEVGAW